MIPSLLNKAFELGYEVTLGDAFRDPRVHGAFGQKLAYGAANSFHKQRLAIDLNLFKDGKYITDDTGHAQLGAWWVTQGGTYGGNFKSKDFNHYSLGEGR
jgi:hypothetical protein